jgi:hypothetical protein
MASSQAGTASSVAVDGSATTTVTFPQAFTTAPVVTLTPLNPSTWDTYQLSAVLIGSPTATGFTMLVSGGPAASTISVSWIAIGTGVTTTTTSTTGTTPQGYSGSTAISAVQLYANEPTLPSAANILTFLNKGIEEVCRQVAGPKLWGYYPTLNLQTLVQLNDDVQEVISANFSTGSVSGNNTTPGSASPFAQGALIYPLTQLDQASFFDAAAGQPAIGFGPPQNFFVYADYGQSAASTVPAPSAPTLGLVSGTSNGSTIYVVITLVNANGETTASSSSSISLSSTAYQAFVPTPAGAYNATGFHVYASSSSSGPFYLQDGGSATTLGNPFTIPYPLATGTATPPITNTATGAGTGGSLYMQLYPAATIGQVNIYYKARPLLWADTTTSSFTNLDTSAQEAAILFAVGRVLVNRGRAAEWKEIWQPEYQGMIDSLKDSQNRRTIAKSGVVRDVVNNWWSS